MRNGGLVSYVARTPRQGNCMRRMFAIMLGAICLLIGCSHAREFKVTVPANVPTYIVGQDDINETYGLRLRHVKVFTSVKSRENFEAIMRELWAQSEEEVDVVRASFHSGAARVADHPGAGTGEYYGWGEVFASEQAARTYYNSALRAVPSKAAAEYYVLWVTSNGGVIVERYKEPPRSPS